MDPDPDPLVFYNGYKGIWVWVSSYPTQTHLIESIWVWVRVWSAVDPIHRLGHFADWFGFLLIQSWARVTKSKPRVDQFSLTACIWARPRLTVRVETGRARWISQPSLARPTGDGRGLLEHPLKQRPTSGGRSSSFHTCSFEPPKSFILASFGFTLLYYGYLECFVASLIFIIFPEHSK
ncbi:hypothetical protein M9H77_29820 [Catharanthus roseus]|uniref:Uncharacterized protein n=1 Tax=Catharanthus roseus TaxID=4058 RepID=A0ACB9ZVI3_CATRO|nr:hypothetical protein M9H77_29820 [Catharanthus roseus]